LDILEILIQLTISGLAIGAIYAFIALGYHIIFTTVKILNFAQGEIVMLGALIGHTFHVLLGLPILLTFFLVGAVCSILGILFNKVVVQPVLKVEGSLSWIISTVAAAIIIRNMADSIWGTIPLPFPPLFSQDPFFFRGIGITPQALFTFFVAMTIILSLALLQTRTIIGKAIRAVAFDKVSAELVGINSKLIIILSFIISFSLSGIAGILISPITFAYAQIGLPLGIKGFAAMALGGLGSGIGALAGGLIIGLAETLASGLLWPGFHDTIALLFLIGILLFKPSGLFGKAITDRY
jgi:branched-chain amino acid transport system permease protein